MRDDVQDIRRRDCWAAIVRVMRAFRGRFGLRIAHYSALGNHLHIVAESDGRAELVAGMQSLTTRLAKAINAVFGRNGGVLAGRYHVRELRTPREVWFALRYVLANWRRHGAPTDVNRLNAPLLCFGVLLAEEPRGSALVRLCRSFRGTNTDGAEWLVDRWRQLVAARLPWHQRLLAVTLPVLPPPTPAERSGT